MINIISDSTIGGQISSGVIYLTAVLTVAFYVVFYLLRSVGIYKLAKGQGLNKAFLAWIPFLWMFTACKIIGKVKIFGKTFEQLAVWACLIFTLAEITPIIYNSFTIVPYVIRFLQGGNIDIIIQNSEITIDPAIQYSQGVETFLRILSVFNYVLRLANVFVTVSVYIYLFRKFWPEHYILVSVLSVFGLFPIFVFATRNRKAVDYAEYVRNRFYGSGYTPYGRNGGNNGAYGNNSYGANAGRDPYDVYGNGDDKEPFGEFSNRPEEPFGEFSDGKNGGDNGYGNDDNEDR